MDAGYTFRVIAIMAFTTLNSGDSILGALPGVINELITAYEERAAVVNQYNAMNPPIDPDGDGFPPFGVPDLTFPYAYPYSGQSIVTIGNAAYSTLRTNIPYLLNGHSDNANDVMYGNWWNLENRRFVKTSDYSNWDDIDDLLNDAGYPAGWDTDYRICNRGIWSQLQDVFSELTVYARMTHWATPLDPNDDGTLSVGTVGAGGTIQQAWDDLIAAPDTYSPAGFDYNVGWSVVKGTGADAWELDQRYYPYSDYYLPIGASSRLTAAKVYIRRWYRLYDGGITIEAGGTSIPVPTGTGYNAQWYFLTDVSLKPLFEVTSSIPALVPFSGLGGTDQAYAYIIPAEPYEVPGPAPMVAYLQLSVGDGLTYG